MSSATRKDPRRDSEEAQAFGVDAVGLALRTRQGPVVRPVTFSADPGALVYAYGSAGSGRTSLGLIISGRMKFSDGDLSVGGRKLPKANRWLRQNSVVAPTGSFYGLDDSLRVSEEVNRAYWYTGRKHMRSDRSQIIVDAGLVGLEKSLVRDLTVLQRRALEVSCAFAGHSGLIVIDDLCGGVPRFRHEQLWELLIRLRTRVEVTVVVTALDPPVEGAGAHCDQMIDLDQQEHDQAELGGSGPVR